MRIMGTERDKRRLEPLSEQIQGALRSLLRDAPSAEQAARALRLPLSTVLAGASGARMLLSTRQRLTAAIERRQSEQSRPNPHRTEVSHLRLVRAPDGDGGER